MKKYIRENKILVSLCSVFLLISVMLIFLKLTYHIQDEGVLINIATEIIGIIITIVFVNWIIDKNNKSLWHKTDLRHTYNMQRYITIFIRHLNSLFDLPTISMNLKKGEHPFDQQYVYYNKYMKETLSPKLTELLKALENKKWNEFFKLINNKLDDAYKIQQLFGFNFQPDYYHIFIDIIEILRDIKGDYELSLNDSGEVDTSIIKELGVSMGDFISVEISNKISLLFNKFEKLSSYLICNKEEVPYYSPTYERE